MANTTSGTVTFDKTFAVDEIIEEAYERIGLQSVSGYQLKTANVLSNVTVPEVVLAICYLLMQVF